MDSEKTFERLSINLARFQKPAKKQTKEQVLASDIYEWSGRQLKFPMLMKFIKEKGEQYIYEIWQEIKKGEANDPIKLFMWKVGQAKIIWQ